MNHKNKIKVYPAMDLMNGKVVRLEKGKKDTKKIYGEPLEIATKISSYTDKVHIVDLDGAFEGRPKNLHIVEEIKDDLDLDIQLGGGFREYQYVNKAYSVGVDNVILGTKAFDSDFVDKVTEQFDGIMVSLDSINGYVSTKGWKESKSVKVEEAYHMLKDKIDRFIFTSVERDGTLMGFDDINRFWEDEEMLYAGGVSSLDDIKRAYESGFNGVIVGKALYEEKLQLDDLFDITVKQC